MTRKLVKMKTKLVTYWAFVPGSEMTAAWQAVALLAVQRTFRGHSADQRVSRSFSTNRKQFFGFTGVGKARPSAGCRLGGKGDEKEGV